MKINKNINVTTNIGATGSNELSNRYFGIFNKIPNYTHVASSLNCKKISNFLMKHGFIKNEHVYNNAFKDTAPYIIRSFISKKQEVYIITDSHNLHILYNDTDISFYLKEFTQKKYKGNTKNAKQLCIIIPDQGSYRTTFHTLKRTEFVPENYNEDFIPVHKKILHTLNKEKSGLYLFYGPPGTGKSSYIASLTQMNTDKKFIYLPSSLFHSLDSPALMQLFLNNRNSVFIIEDGEKLLANRENENNSPISALLNMSDGLIGQLLNSQIICTFNTSLDRIDEALMRNGRLLCMHEFGPLDKERAINLAKKIKKPYEHITGSMTLADIYNQTKEAKKEFKSSRKAIGFAK